MPSASEHEEQAASNADFYTELGGKDALRSDWAMTALFYVAVQEVQALIMRKGWRVRDHGRLVIPATHGQRIEVLRTNCPHVLTGFKALKDWSEAARYGCERFTSAQLTLAERTLEAFRVDIAALG